MEDLLKQSLKQCLKEFLEIPLSGLLEALFGKFLDSWQNSEVTTEKNS